MKSLIAFMLCFSLLFSSQPLRAADSPVQDIPPGQDKIVVVKKGDPAPFDGQLYDNPTALRWGNWLLQYKYRLKSDVELATELGEANTELWHKKYDLLEDRYKLVTTDYQKQVATLQSNVLTLKHEVDNPVWYKTPMFGFTIGVLLAFGTVGLSAYALHAAAK